MTDNFNKYYTTLLHGMKKTYKNIDGSTEFQNAPETFPFMYFKQLDLSTVNTSLSNAEDSARLSIEVRLYNTGTENELRKMAVNARGILIPLGFVCSLSRPVENAIDTCINEYVIS